MLGTFNHITNFLKNYFLEQITLEIKIFISNIIDAFTSTLLIIISLHK